MPELTTTILIIEDDRQIRRVVQGYLEQAGYRVLSAADGDAGLALAQAEKPALLVLDLMLPGLDGWEITQRLRQSSRPGSLPASTSSC
jgi:DNA-binding response OmpR family regulator